MAVEIQEVELVPRPPASSDAPAPESATSPAVLHPALELELERAVRLRQSRDLRLHAD